MGPDEIDATEIAAMERAAEQRAQARNAPGPGPVHPAVPPGPKSAASSDAINTPRVARPSGSDIPRLILVAEDGTASALIDAAAIDARLAQLERIVQHTHLLVIALADLFRVQDTEVDEIRRRILAHQSPTEASPV